MSIDYLQEKIVTIILHLQKASQWTLPPAAGVALWATAPGLDKESH